MNPASSPQSLLQKAAQIPRLERGTLSIIREGPGGAFYNHQYRQDGKKVSRYVPRDQVAAVQEAIDGYRRFDQLIQDYVDQVVEKTRAEIAADSKKNQSPPQNSSSPKMRKSSN
jgi:hypothetical protein